MPEAIATGKARADSRESVSVRDASIGARPMQDALSVESVLVRAQSTLSRAGCDAPRLDAELLLASVLETTRTRLVLERAQVVPGDAPARFQALLSRRAAREPIAYILGHKEFRRISLAVDHRVLIPRPETELLVELGLSLGSGVRVADVGTGSGAVALALKDERPDLDVSGLDSSADALVVARANARRLGIAVRFVEADLLTRGAEDYDAVLANLPYVAEDSAELEPDVARYEPPAALFGGADGLDVVRRLASMLDPISLVALEVGFDQAEAVSGLLRERGFAAVERLRDLAGHDRVIVGRR
ncbi:MAG: peptide chain release factor N(5)-glutamine methyltransferase [Solirubrobacteraceae bacterium]